MRSWPRTKSKVGIRMMNTLWMKNRRIALFLKRGECLSIRKLLWFIFFYLTLNNFRIKNQKKKRIQKVNCDFPWENFYRKIRLNSGGFSFCRLSLSPLYNSQLSTKTQRRSEKWVWEKKKKTWIAIIFIQRTWLTKFRRSKCNLITGVHGYGEVNEVDKLRHWLIENIVELWF